MLAGFRQPRNLLAIDYDTLQVAAGLRSRDGKEEAPQGGPGGRQPHAVSSHPCMFCDAKRQHLPDEGILHDSWHTPGGTIILLFEVRHLVRLISVAFNLGCVLISVTFDLGCV